jgi:hypothetical protein
VGVLKPKPAKSMYSQELNQAASSCASCKECNSIWFWTKTTVPYQPNAIPPPPGICSPNLESRPCMILIYENLAPSHSSDWLFTSSFPGWLILFAAVIKYGHF